MVETYRFFVDAGADAVVNHHQHCFCGYEVYKGKPIFYGLGNFCFDWKVPYENANWNYGYAVTIDFRDGGEVDFELHPYEQCNGAPRLHLLPPQAFESRLRELNATIADPTALDEATRRYYASESEGILNALFTTRSRVLNALLRRGLRRWLEDERSRLRIKNTLCCESHLDKVQYAVSAGLPTAVDKNGF